MRIYVKPNRHFRLPEDGNRPIIMIGAGTGVAPYRAFIEDRVEDGAKGKSWLVFGERNFTNDFLYQLEWQEYLADGALSRIDVAFSRDQPEKIYVQQRLWEAPRRAAQSGSRTARTSTCAATRRAWRATLTSCSAASSRKPPAATTKPGAPS